MVEPEASEKSEDHAAVAACATSVEPTGGDGGGADCTGVSEGCLDASSQPASMGRSISMPPTTVGGKGKAPPRRRGPGGKGAGRSASLTPPPPSTRGKGAATLPSWNGPRPTDDLKSAHIVNWQPIRSANRWAGSVWEQLHGSSGIDDVRLPEDLMISAFMCKKDGTNTRTGEPKAVFIARRLPQEGALAADLQYTLLVRKGIKRPEQLQWVLGGNYDNCLVDKQEPLSETVLEAIRGLLLAATGNAHRLVVDGKGADVLLVPSEAFLRRLILEVAPLETLQARVEYALHMAGFPSKAAMLESELNGALLAIWAVIQSASLPVLLRCVLVLGNYVNAASRSLGGAVGVTLGSLAKLAHTRCRLSNQEKRAASSVKGATVAAPDNALSMVVTHLECKRPTFTECLCADLEGCRAAKDFDQKAVAVAVQEIATQFHRVEALTRQARVDDGGATGDSGGTGGGVVATSGCPEALTLDRLESFVAQASPRVAALERLVSEVADAANALRRWLAEPAESGLGSMLANLAALRDALPAANDCPLWRSSAAPSGKSISQGGENAPVPSYRAAVSGPSIGGTVSRSPLLAQTPAPRAVAILPMGTNAAEVTHCTSSMVDMSTIPTADMQAVFLSDEDVPISLPQSQSASHVASGAEASMLHGTSFDVEEVVSSLNTMSGSETALDSLVESTLPSISATTAETTAVAVASVVETLGKGGSASATSTCVANSTTPSSVLTSVGPSTGSSSMQTLETCLQSQEARPEVITVSEAAAIGCQGVCPDISDSDFATTDGSGSIATAASICVGSAVEAAMTAPSASCIVVVQENDVMSAHTTELDDGCHSSPASISNVADAVNGPAVAPPSPPPPPPQPPPALMSRLRQERDAPYRLVAKILQKSRGLVSLSWLFDWTAAPAELRAADWADRHFEVLQRDEDEVENGVVIRDAARPPLELTVPIGRCHAFQVRAVIVDTTPRQDVYREPVWASQATVPVRVDLRHVKASSAVLADVRQQRHEEPGFDGGSRESALGGVPREEAATDIRIRSGSGDSEPPWKLTPSMTPTRERSPVSQKSETLFVKANGAAPKVAGSSAYAGGEARGSADHDSSQRGRSGETSETTRGGGALQVDDNFIDGLFYFLCSSVTRREEGHF
eukprot:TRINITY_DN74194_c0_g1_i1.p1 TRINITY_DN74194_c0_g1~~TRINITY_DN74194_c0_g1_i1.p1  ORF type:complete len:1142 (+),score=219.30 TRINITY_DN74194_c0_g1_i1:88-3513(+)